MNQKSGWSKDLKFWWYFWRWTLSFSLALICHSVSHGPIRVCRRNLRDDIPNMTSRSTMCTWCHQTCCRGPGHNFSGSEEEIKDNAMDATRNLFVKVFLPDLTLLHFWKIIWLLGCKYFWSKAEMKHGKWSVLVKTLVKDP